MKPRNNSFEEAVKKALKPKEKQLNEAGPFVPAGLTVASTGNVSRASRSQMPPYSAYSDIYGKAPGTPDLRDMQPDQGVNKPKRMPYPLETSRDYLNGAFDNLSAVKSQIGLTFGNPAVLEAKSGALKKIENKISTVLGQIRKIYQEIGAITLD